MLTHFPSESLSDSQWGPDEKVVKHFGGVGVDAGEKLYVQLLCPLQVFPEGGADITILLYYGFPQHEVGKTWGGGRWEPRGEGVGVAPSLSPPVTSSSFCD